MSLQTLLAVEAYLTEATLIALKQEYNFTLREEKTIRKMAANFCCMHSSLFPSIDVIEFKATYEYLILTLT
jgi:hypothetical protein